MARTSEELEKLAKAVLAAKPPVILTRAEALDTAASFLESNARSLGMVTDILKLVGSDFGGIHASVVAEIRKQAVEPDLQIAAMKSGAQAIRELALEERVIAARTAREQDRTR